MRCGDKPLCRVWKNNTGALKVENRYIQYGLKGSADILGVRHDGKFIAIEIKVGKDRQSEDQKNFEKMILSMNGIYVLAKSVNDAVAGIQVQG